MQTTRSQSQQAGQKVDDAFFESASASRPLATGDKFGIWLLITVFFPYLMFLTMMLGLVIKFSSLSPRFLVHTAAVLVVTTAFIAISYGMIYFILKERRSQRRELSRAKALVAITDALNATGKPLREKMKQAGHMLAEEGEDGGWRCRIVLHEDPSVLPPIGKIGFHVPMLVGDQNIGALVITPIKGKFDQVDQNFFVSLANSIGLFLFKEKIWTDFHSEMDRLRAALLLNADTSPQPTSSKEPLTVEHMLRMLGLIKGNVENSVDNKL